MGGLSHTSAAVVPYGTLAPQSCMLPCCEALLPATVPCRSARGGCASKAGGCAGGGYSLLQVRWGKRSWVVSTDAVILAVGCEGRSHMTAMYSTSTAAAAAADATAQDWLPIHRWESLRWMTSFWDGCLWLSSWYPVRRFRSEAIACSGACIVTDALCTGTR